MFGGDLVPPKCTKRVKPNPMKYDIQFPSVHPAYYQHVAREPNTDYHVKYLHFQQRKTADDILRERKAKDLASSDAITIKYDKHAEKKHIKRMIRERVQEKLHQYEISIEKRRQKLRELLYDEERQFYYETVDAAQRGDETKMEDMKNRVQHLRAQREAERMKVVQEKRIQQYRDRCLELRPYLIQKHLVETKNAQLQQIRENESKRESERELEMMWHHLNEKEVQARREREEQEAIAAKRKQLDLTAVWDMQVKGKELLRAEVEKVAQEDAIQLQKLAEQLKREQIEALDAKRRKRDETDRELREQLESNKQMSDQRKKGEQALEDAFATLAELEIQKAKAAVQDFTTQAKKESVLYRRNLRQLDEERKREEKELDALLASYKEEIDRKQDEARCKILMAKQAMQKDVMEGNAQQIALKRHLAQEQLKVKEAENELLRLTYDQNERLQAESDRLEREIIRQYRDDLKKQIDYNNLLRQREQELLEKQMRQGEEEEAKYRKIVEDMIMGRVEPGQKHPFRKALEKFDCHCPPPEKK